MLATGIIGGMADWAPAGTAEMAGAPPVPVEPSAPVLEASPTAWAAAAACTAVCCA